LHIKKINSNNTIDDKVNIISFSNKTVKDKKLLKKFVDFNWMHYKNDPQYVPLLDCEYLGSRLLGIIGFFESKNLFFKHAEMKFFLALRNNKVVGRCNAFINFHHNKHWKDNVGFFGHFESIDNQEVANALLKACECWLKSKGMDSIRGPQNLPVNEATPGIMTDGFSSRPVTYYHYNKPYYEKLLSNAGFEPIKRVFSWEIPVMNPMEEKLEHSAKRVINRFNVTTETLGERPIEERKREMFEVYNEAWSDNFGFVPFAKEEFDSIFDEMKLILNKDLFIFLYVKGELAAFFGGVPNIAEKMTPIQFLPRCELLRAANLFFAKNYIKGFRLGYLGAKRKFRRMGLPGVMAYEQKIYVQKAGYQYCDVGWVLEDNVMVLRSIQMMKARLSKTYTIFQKPIDKT